MDPDPGDADDILTQNGYTYANNNPVMLVDPDGHWVWLAINAGFAAYDGYKAYKSGKGWKGVAAAAAIGFVGGGKFKLVRNTGRFIIKGTGKASKYVDVTKYGSRYANRATDVSKAQFEKNLLRDGWKKSISKDGKTIILTKDGAKYVLRDGAKSTGGPTADFYPKGSKRMTLKIRLKK
ncbi:hypothetical protein PspKH34_16680 [Parageobacillus sp. KH3-4]|nr:hypothetical protein PspKH34_16680 [Parageobacillus sp. KH3-4]